MTNKNTRRAFLASLMALLLCVSSLLGTTYAWFTDSVTSSNNIISSGNLDVELYYQVEGQSDWTKVTDTTNIFKENALWEPGHTEVVKLKVVNEGTLALKYNLGVNVASEIGSVNAAGNPFKLSDFIKYGIVEGAQDYTRDEAIAAVDANATPIKFAYSTDYISLEAANAGDTDEKTVTMVVYMPTTVSNEANYAKGAAVPTINLGLNLFATQQTAETDSWGNDYDENAPFSVWNGVVPTEMPASLVVDGATQTIHVKDADAFAYLGTLSAKWVDFYTDGNGRTYTNYANGAGADYYYSGKWTISLEADIDLANYAIAPVTIVIGEATGASTFNGNGHTIRNINTTTGLFADKARTTISDLTLVNVKATNGALIGSADHNISNITVKNAMISGIDYVGGLTGKAYSSVKGCQVIDSSVIATGKEAGGLVGYAETNSNGSTITTNIVKNVTVYAGNRAAGLIAQPNSGVKVYGNLVDTVIVGVSDTSQYQPGAVVSNAIDPDGVYDNTVKNANIATKAATAKDDTTLDTAIASGADTIFLGSGEYKIPDSAKGKTLTVVGNGDTVVASQDDGAAEGDCDYSFDGSTVTFENVTITTSTTYFPGYARMKGIYNNCTINGVWTLYDNSEFTNCTFNVSGDVYNVWTWGAAKATFTNCTFNNDGKAILVYGGGSTKLTVNGCTFNDNGGLTSKKAAIEVGSGYGSSFELIINNTVVNGYEINDEGTNTGTTLWANKNSMGTDKLNVVVDGVEVY